MRRSGNAFHPKLREEAEHRVAFVQARRAVIDIRQQVKVKIDRGWIEHGLASFDAWGGWRIPPPILSC
jgi:hypothetical protein